MNLSRRIVSRLAAQDCSPRCDVMAEAGTCSRRELDWLHNLRAVQSSRGLAVTGQGV